MTPEHEKLLTRLEEIYGAYHAAADTVAAFTEDARTSLMGHVEYVSTAKKKLDAANASKYGLMGRPGVSLREMFTAEFMHESFIEQRASIVHLYPNLLTEMALIYQVALFDAYVPDMIKAVLLYRPEILKSKDRQLTYEEILNLHAKSRIVEDLVDREVDRFSRQSIREQIKWISRKLQVNYVSNEGQENVMVELNARRNILVHNNGIVNQLYLNAVPNSTLVVGERIIVDGTYWSDCKRFLRNAAVSFVLALARQHCPGSHLDDIE
jgi:hypothetical protein